MKESLADKARAVLYSLLLHAFLIGLIALGLLWTTATRTVVMPGPVIEASLIGPTSAPKPASRKSQAKPERPKPTPPPPKVEEEKPKPDAAPPPEPPKQDLVEQQRIAALAEQKADELKKEQEEKRRREQILLEQEKQEAARQKELEQVRKELAAV